MKQNEHCVVALLLTEAVWKIFLKNEAIWQFLRWSKLKGWISISIPGLLVALWVTFLLASNEVTKQLDPY